MRKILFAACFAVLVHGTASAATITVDVFAKENSSSGGVGQPVTTVSAGELLTISVNTDDLWSAGALPRWSNANGITGQLLATGTDETGLPAGTVIGNNQFGQHTQFSLTAPFGSLVGEIDGTYFVVGTFFSGASPDSGLLRLLYWDSNNNDNFGSVRASIRTASEPVTLVLFGLAALVGVRRRRMA